MCLAVVATGPSMKSRWNAPKSFLNFINSSKTHITDQWRHVMTTKAITNVTIFDGTGTDPYPGEVLIDGNRITSVSAPGKTLDKVNDQIIQNHKSVEYGKQERVLIDISGRSN